MFKRIESMEDGCVVVLPAVVDGCSFVGTGTGTGKDGSMVGSYVEGASVAVATGGNVTNSDDGEIVSSIEIGSILMICGACVVGACVVGACVTVTDGGLDGSDEREGENDREGLEDGCIDCVGTSVGNCEGLFVGSIVGESVGASVLRRSSVGISLTNRSLDL